MFLVYVLVYVYLGSDYIMCLFILYYPVVNRPHQPGSESKDLNSF